MFKTDEEFENAKEEILEKVIPYELHPDMFPTPKLTHEEIAILFAKDRHDVKSKMAICKFEHRTLSKLREKLSKIGVKSLDDALDLGRMREIGSPGKAFAE